MNTTITKDQMRNVLESEYRERGTNAFVETMALFTRIRKEIEAIESSGVSHEGTVLGYSLFHFSNIICYFEVLSDLLKNDPVKAEEIRELRQFWISHETYFREVYHMQ